MRKAILLHGNGSLTALQSRLRILQSWGANTVAIGGVSAGDCWGVPVLQIRLTVGFRTVKMAAHDSPVWSGSFACSLFFRVCSMQCQPAPNQLSKFNLQEVVVKLKVSGLFPENVLVLMLAASQDCNHKPCKASCPALDTICPLLNGNEACSSPRTAESS